MIRHFRFGLAVKQIGRPFMLLFVAIMQKHVAIFICAACLAFSGQASATIYDITRHHTHPEGTKLISGGWIVTDVTGTGLTFSELGATFSFDVGDSDGALITNADVFEVDGSLRANGVFKDAPLFDVTSEAITVNPDYDGVFEIGYITGGLFENSKTWMSWNPGATSGDSFLIVQIGDVVIDQRNDNDNSFPSQVGNFTTVFPEPTTLTLAALAVLGFTCRRPRRLSLP